MNNIENAAKHIIDRCIPALQSTELGIQLIENIQTVQTRKCLIEHMLTKHDSIIKKFIYEIEIVEKEFQVLDGRFN